VGDESRSHPDDVAPPKYRELSARGANREGVGVRLWLACREGERFEIGLIQDKGVGKITGGTALIAGGRESEHKFRRA